MDCFFREKLVKLYHSRSFRFVGCCIYHRKKAFAESDSDESDSDTEVAKKNAKKPGNIKAYQRHHA